MAGQRVEINEALGYDSHVIVTTATGGASMTGMQVALVLDFDCFCREGCAQPVGDVRHAVHDGAFLKSRAK